MKLEKDDILKLAKLARISVTDKELESFGTELGSIIGYISEINEITDTADQTRHEHKNVFREDVVTNTPGEYTDAILQNAPARKDNYLKVDQVL